MCAGYATNIFDSNSHDLLERLLISKPYTNNHNNHTLDVTDYDHNTTSDLADSADSDTVVVNVEPQNTTTKHYAVKVPLAEGVTRVNELRSDVRDIDGSFSRRRGFRASVKRRSQAIQKRQQELSAAGAEEQTVGEDKQTTVIA